MNFFDSAETHPLITVVISTRDRGNRIISTIQTILSSDYPHFELIVVDQSSDDLTEASVHSFLSDSRVQYLRTNSRGVSKGHNLGISKARSEFIAITGDDIEVSRNWLSEIISAFARDPRIGIVFGNVRPCRFDPSKGFVTSYIRKDPFLARHVSEKHLVEGISGCMALRKKMWQELYGFDAALGAGSPLRSAAETDFTFRALRAGYYVYETPKAEVIHCSFYPWKQGRKVIRRYLFGIGAMLAKHLKCNPRAALPLFFSLASRWAFKHPVVNLGKRSYRFLRLASFLQGFFAGVMTSVDRTQCHFVILQ